MPERFLDPRLEVKFGGFGGQGIISAGYMFGKAAALFGGRYATMTQSYGPESRGGACSALVVVSSQPGGYPALTRLNYFVSLSQEAADTYASQAGPQTVVLVDRDMVQWRRSPKAIRVPAVALAESLGNKLAANVIMLGALCRVLARGPAVVAREALEKAISSQFKPSLVSLNLKAFAAGYEWEAPEDAGQEILDAMVKSGSPG